MEFGVSTVLVTADSLNGSFLRKMLSGPSFLHIFATTVMIAGFSDVPVPCRIMRMSFFFCNHVINISLKCSMAVICCQLSRCCPGCDCKGQARSLLRRQKNPKPRPLSIQCVHNFFHKRITEYSVRIEFAVIRSPFPCSESDFYYRSAPTG